jgi:predicted RNase H-like nuclease (RuvC/YqgF family)
VLLKDSREQDHAFRMEQVRTKIADVKEIVERQERENKKLAGRISGKKEEYEDRTKRIKSLLDEIEKT